MSIADIYAGKDCPSWVIVDKVTRRPMMETYQASVAAKVNTAKYEAVPILEYLQSLNRG